MHPILLVRITGETRTVRGRIGKEKVLGYFSGSLKITKKVSQNFFFSILIIFSNFLVLENINMMRDVNKQLQLVLEDTLFKVFYMHVIVTRT